MTSSHARARWSAPFSARARRPFDKLRAGPRDCRRDPFCFAQGRLPALQSESEFSSVVRNHAQDFGSIRIADQHRFRELVLALLSLGSEHVAKVRMMTQHLAGGGFLEALGGAFMSFEFWHMNSIS